jgi:hypothetical protein
MKSNESLIKSDILGGPVPTLPEAGYKTWSIKYVEAAAVVRSLFYAFFSSVNDELQGFGRKQS